MFTGIIEEIGKIQMIQKGTRSAKITILAKTIMQDIKRGDSIAVDGVCLTVDHIGDQFFTADVMPQTLNRSTLTTVQIGQWVNLERALTPQTRMGGHMVSGHVDCVATIKAISYEDIAKRFWIEMDEPYMRYLVSQGSIAVDGISLTIATIEKNMFSVSVIPVTNTHTSLHTKKEKDRVNIEIDMLAKYVEKLLQSPEKKHTKLNMSFLQDHGFGYTKNQ